MCHFYKNILPILYFFRNILHTRHWGKVSLLGPVISHPFVGLIWKREKRIFEKKWRKSRRVSFNQSTGRFVKEGVGQKQNLGSNSDPHLGPTMVGPVTKLYLIKVVLQKVIHLCCPLKLCAKSIEIPICRDVSMNQGLWVERYKSYKQL